MAVEVTFLTPDRSAARPYRARITTRDEAGKLVGVRFLYAHNSHELREKVEQFRGVNAHDDIANQPKGSDA